MDFEKYRSPDGEMPAWVSEFERCAQWIEDALEYSGGTHSLEDVADLLAMGQVQLWPGRTAAIVSQIQTFPRISCLHVFLAGGNIEELAQMRPVVEQWAKSVGCAKITIVGRRGWGRCFLQNEGYRPEWTTVVKDL